MRRRTLKPQKHLLFTAISCAVASLAIGVSGTLAFFTSTQETETAVTMGTVKLTESIDSTTFQYFSYGSEEAKTAFASGGTASLGKDGSLSIADMCPGDKFTFDAKLTNESTIAIQYRVTLKKKDGSEVTPFVLEGDSAEGKMEKTENEKTLHLSISLPKEVSDPTLMGQKVVFVLKTEAIQGNVSFEEAA